MKISNIIGWGVLSIGLVALPMVNPVSAQDATTPGAGTTTTTPVTDDNNDFDWGWLGLIGLAGLAGLAGKNRPVESTRYQDPTVTSTTSRSDYR